MLLERIPFRLHRSLRRRGNWRTRGRGRQGPKEPKSTVLSVEDEAVIVAFRRHTLLPLDDCLYALQATIPHLTRSSLHRCFQRHGIGRLPEVEGARVPKKKFKSYPIDFFHIDIAEIQTPEGRLYLLVAVDRTSKFAFVELHQKATRRVAADFFRNLIAAVPYKVHTVLTDNGTHFSTPGEGGSAVPAGGGRRQRAFRNRLQFEHGWRGARHSWPKAHLIACSLAMSER